MFCANCGKQIIDTAHFCTYCGVGIVNFDEKPVEKPAESEENPVSIPDDNVYNSGNVENSVDLLNMNSTVSPSIPKMNEPPKSGEAPFNGGLNAEIPGGAAAGQNNQTGQIGQPDQPGQPNQSGQPGQPNQPGQADQAGQVGQPNQPGQAGQISQPDQPNQAGQPNQPENPKRRYTIGHIIMCLASAAVMAIAAGVFAGLYFSVV